METRAAKTDYLDKRKREIVESGGCKKCGLGGKPEEGFEQYWYDDFYRPRRFVFKYVDRRGSTIPVAKLPRYKNSTFKTIDEALSRCVILCRSCADPRRTRKEMTQCPEKTS